MSTDSKRAARQRRHQRIRRSVRGTPARPRLVVYRSNAHIYAQIVDDTAGRTLVSASSLDESVASDGDGKVGAAKGVGKLVGERAKEAGVEAVVFDRGGNRYHGRVAALAEGAREAGLEF